MSKKYGHLPNVIYEPWNEPEKVSWDADVRPYMEQIIQVIRKNDPDNLILAGTPWWCLRVDEVASSPLGDSNTMYVLHFYAGSHRQETRDRADQALSRRLPLFVSEFGLSHADGGRNADRKVYFEEADRWMAWLDQNQISWANWSLCDKDEASAALRPGGAIDGAWIDSELSASGIYVRDKLRNHGLGQAKVARAQ
jgi:endoglucanase